MKRLQQRLVDASRQLAEIEKELETIKDKRSRIEQRKSDAEATRTQTLALVEHPGPTARAQPSSALAERLETMRAEALGEHQLTVESCDNREQEVRKWLQDRIDVETKKLDRLRDKIIQAMMAHEHLWGEETAPVVHDLPRLTETERTSFDELRDNRIRKSLRLEQEQVGGGRLTAEDG